MPQNPIQLSNVPVLVTGGAGFIGGHLVHALVENGANVRVLDDFSSGSPANLPVSQIEVITGDIRRPVDCARAMQGRKIVFHLAALGSVPRSVEQPAIYNDVNIAGTLNILDAAKKAGVKRVVYSASSSAYGDTPVLPKIETMPPSPGSPYAVTKLAGEYYCRVFAHIYNLSTISLRYFNVFGPRQNPHSQYAAVIPAFINALQNNHPPKIYGDGEQSRDFCYVANVVHANLLAAQSDKPLAGEVVNIACAQRITLNAMLAEMQRLLKTNIKPEHLPPRPGDVRDSLADITAARTLLGYTPEILFNDGLKMTVQSYAAK